MCIGGCNMGFQNLIYCPDCDREVSIYAETCPHCGRPIKKYLEENNINDFTRGFICPRCGVHEINYAGHCRRVNCEYCRVPFIQTKYEMVDLLNHHGCDKESILNDLKDLNVEDQFDQNAYNKRRHEEEEWLKQYREKNNYQNPPSTNQPHCPTCGSTDIIKISAAKKAMGAGLFGLFSKTAKSQFECKNCGYKW